MPRKTAAEAVQPPDRGPWKGGKRLPSKRSVGRPSKFTPEVEDALIQAFRLGASKKIAVGSVGVHERTFDNWMQSGRDAKSGRYRRFYLAIEKARNRGDLELLASVKQATQGVKCRTCHGQGSFPRDGKLISCPACKGDGYSMKPDGRLALEFLSRRQPQDYAKQAPQRIELTGAGGGAVKYEADVRVVAASIDLGGLSIEALAALAWGEVDEVEVPAIAPGEAGDIIDADEI